MSMSSLSFLIETEYKRQRIEFDANLSPCLWPKSMSQVHARAAMAFIRCCRTWDEIAQEESHLPERSYIRAYVRRWVKAFRKRRPLVVEKSRRIIISWVSRCLELWVYGLNRANGLLVGKTHLRSSEHLWRIWFIYNRLRRDYPDWHLPKATKLGNDAMQQLDEIALPNGSRISKHYDGPTGIQGTGFTIVVIEELSQFQDASSMWAQAQMVAQGGGFVCSISNASFSDSWRAVKGGLKARDVLQFGTESFAPMRWVQIGGSSVEYLAMHYTADHVKTWDWGRETKISANIPDAEWDREMELHEKPASGVGVFASCYRPECADSGAYVAPEHALVKWLCSWDAGQTLSPAVMLWKIYTRENGTPIHARGVAECLPEVQGESMDSFAPRVVNWLTGLGVPVRDVLHVADPTVMNRSGSDGRSALQVARLYGITLMPSTNNWSYRLACATWLLRQPGLFGYDNVAMPTLHGAFNGGYRYEEHAKSGFGASQILVMPLKNQYSHIADAFQYGAIQIMQMANVRPQGSHKVSPPPLAGTIEQVFKDLLPENKKKSRKL